MLAGVCAGGGGEPPVVPAPRVRAHGPRVQRLPAAAAAVDAGAAPAAPPAAHLRPRRAGVGRQHPR